MSLFDNPHINNARSQMSKEELDEYERKGKDMYNTVDFTTSTIINPDPNPCSLVYIVRSLRSGLHPDDLLEEEVQLLVKYYGEDWKSKF